MNTSFLYDPELPVTLYTWVMSPFAMKVHSLLLFKRISFRCSYVNPLRRKSEIPVGDQIPVVRIGDQLRADSTPIGHWLDEIYPNQPLLLPLEEEHKQRVIALDQWVTERLIPIVFRIPQEPGFNTLRITNGWKLSRVMSLTAHGGLPKLVQRAWPAILASMSFLQKELTLSDPNRSIEEVQAEVSAEFVAHLAGGPFLGAYNEPSMADAAAFPQFLLPYLAGMDRSDYFLEYPEIVNWLKAMAPHVQGNPPLLPAIAQQRQLEWLKL